MVKVLIDTCVWLELAKTPDKIKLLNVINDLLDQQLLSLLIPKPILDEIQRNKERIITDSNKGLQSAVKKAKLVVEAHGESQNKKAVIEHLNNVGFKINSLQESSLHVIKMVETLLSKASTMEVTDDIIVKAAHRAIDKKAPFHRSKNSMNDAIIMECFGKCIAEKDENDQFYFVSLNVNDFSNTTVNNNLPHPDFADYFSRPNHHYSIDLEETIRKIEPELVEELFADQDDYFEEPRLLSEILDAENELFDKIWYNRHLNSLFTQNGNFDLSKSHPGYSAALKIEKKYGRENLRWDDFEWGMLNGKLSALRWVLGDDWDFLDT